MPINMAKLQLQTPRRSTRHLPQTTPGRAWNDLYRAWCGKPLYTRPVNLQLDDVPDEIQQNAEGNEVTLETSFYRSFEMKDRLLGTRLKRRGRGEQSCITTYGVGDTILVETDEYSLECQPPDIGVILSMWETRPKDSEVSDPNAMRIRVHWFVRPNKFKRSFGGKRDHAKNEIYYTLDGATVVYPTTIVGQCTVTSKPPSDMEVKDAEAWAASSTKKKRGAFRTAESDNDTSFFCRFANKSKNGLYFDFNWEKHYMAAYASATQLPDDDDPQWGLGLTWNLDIAGDSRRKTSQQKKRVTAALQGESETDVIDDDYSAESEGQEDNSSTDGEESDRSSASDVASDGSGYENTPKTPSKKRKRAQPASLMKRNNATTPKKIRKRTIVHPTPHSKAAMKKGRKGKSSGGKKFKLQPQTLGYAAYDLSHLPKDSWLRSMHVLHVGSRPDVLPCREEEFEMILRSVGELLEEGSGGCVYIAGTPGTGKTATVHAVVRELQRMAENGETDPFTYVEINGLKIPEPAAAYNLLWESLSEHDIEKNGRMRLSAKESLKALTLHFSGRMSRGPESHACIVLMDELDQLLTRKQDVVYNFFNWPTLVGSKLIVIAVANTMDLPERVMTGRVRSRIGMTRINFSTYKAPQLQQIVDSRLKNVRDSLGDGAQEVLTQDAIKLAAMKVSSISGDARRMLDICRCTVELVMPENRAAKAPDVKEVIRVMQNSPTAAYLRELSFHERLMLASLIKCIKREGVDQIPWDEVKHQHLNYLGSLASPSDPTRRPTSSEFSLVLDSLVASRAMIIEEGAAAFRKPDGERKVALILNQSEVETVLGDVGGQVWKNVLCT